MKKIFLISVIFSLLVFTACSSDKPTGELLPESEVSDDDIVDTDTDSTDEDTDPADSGENGNDEDTADTDTDTNDDDSGDTDTGDTDTGDSDTGDSDTSNTDSGDTDTGNTDTGDSDTGDSDTGNTDTGDTDTGDSDTGDTDTGDTEPTEEEKCITAGGNWSASDGCTKTAQCTGKPENSEWNGDDFYTLHYTDGGWEEETAAAYNDLEAGLCRYKCKPNFLWNDVSKECLPPVPGRICTNQKKCYNNKAEIDCSGSDYPGQDPYFAALGKCIQQRFEVKTPVSGQPVVIDLNTGLRWEQSYSSEQYNWGNAANHCKDLNEMNDFSGYAGYKDWRVPTNQEFFTIVDSGRSKPAFDGTVFTNMNELYGNGSVLWTSQDMNDGSGYYFTPNDGGNWYREKTRENHVVCVSGGKMPGASFDVQENVVVDETTGLVWQRGYASDKTWVQALNYCKKLGEDKYAGFDDWRLPNKNELTSLLDLDKNSAPYSAFPDIPDEEFWSSSTFADNLTLAWVADFSQGLMTNDTKDDDRYYAICVR